MKHERLSEAMEQIRDDYIDEAAAYKPRRRLPWLGAVAAVLALVLSLGLLLKNAPAQPLLPDPDSSTPAAPLVDHTQYLVVTPQYPQVCAYPMENDFEQYESWRANQKLLHTQPEGYADNLQTYFAHLIPTLLTQNQGENVTCSPVNIYMALAILAESTGGESRQQILNLLRSDSIEALRAQAGQVWQAHYNDDGLSTCVLGASVWLDQDVTYNENTVNTLAGSYYASVFRGPLGTQEMNGALQSWLNDQTGGMLQGQAQNTKLDPNSVLAIATTVLYQVQWQDEFWAENNTQGTFQGTSGNTQVTFMNRELSYGPYYRAEGFSAVYLPLEDNSRMWLLLPDPGTTPEEILENGQVSRFFSAPQTPQEIIVELSLPKFDISSDVDLITRLQNMGVTDIFTPGKADFSPLLPQEDGGYVNQVRHAARVSIDEKGVTASAFTVIDRCGSGMPPRERVEFTLDRPFLFYIESQDGLPLFTGIVNEA